MIESTISKEGLSNVGPASKKVQEIFKEAEKRRETNLWSKGSHVVRCLGPVYDLGISEDCLGYAVEDTQTGKQQTLTKDEFWQYTKVEN